MAVAGNRGQHLRAIREEECVADIKENDAPHGHGSILLKALSETTLYLRDLLRKESVISKPLGARRHFPVRCNVMSLSASNLVISGLMRTMRAALAIHL